MVSVAAIHSALSGGGVKTVIGPHAPSDWREWDCQCARCGSTLTRERCGACGGDGEVLEEDFFGDDSEERGGVACSACGGTGGWWACISSEEFCKGHPLPEREKVERHTPEWFAVDPKRGVANG